ncbi:hypothetical protein LTR50_006619 [Elasticomyces elasticus]|nr:hypothetical protein LTR50_006619 [Elasticomyces elasticus]
MADQFFLRVTAGPTYEASTQQEVHVNTDEAVHISTKEIEADIKIRIQNYRGPPGSHTTSPYFAPGSKHEHDLYSIAFSFSIPSSSSVPNGQDLVFGNDFDHPVRDKLPPGFGVAFKFATSYIDPGLYGDVYADEPYLYSPLLSTINTFRVSKKSPNAKNSVNGARKEQDSGAKPIDSSPALATSSPALATSAPTDAKDEDQEDGVDEEEQSWPSNEAERRKYFLKDENRKQFSFETDKEYICDFFNPYLDFNGMSATALYNVRFCRVVGRNSHDQKTKIVLLTTLSTLRCCGGCTMVSSRVYSKFAMQKRRKELLHLWP